MLCTVLAPYEIIYYLYFTDLKQFCEMFKKPYNRYRYTIPGTATAYFYCLNFQDLYCVLDQESRKIDLFKI